MTSDDDLRERCRCLELDVTDGERCRAVVDRIYAETGRLTVW